LGRPTVGRLPIVLSRSLLKSLAYKARLPRTRASLTRAPIEQAKLELCLSFAGGKAEPSFSNQAKPSLVSLNRSSSSYTLGFFVAKSLRFSAAKPGAGYRSHRGRIATRFGPGPKGRLTMRPKRLNHRRWLLGQNLNHRRWVASRSHRGRIATPAPAPDPTTNSRFAYSSSARASKAEL
jgi:hypothetical protein